MNSQLVVKYHTFPSLNLLIVFELALRRQSSTLILSFLSLPIEVNTVIKKDVRDSPMFIFIIFIFFHSGFITVSLCHLCFNWYLSVFVNFSEGWHKFKQVICVNLLRVLFCKQFLVVLGLPKLIRRVECIYADVTRGLFY